MLSDKEFIGTIYEHQQIIFKVCNMYMDTAADREDLFQEILLNAWKGIKNFKGEAKFSTWLYRVSLNTAISYFKKTKKQEQSQQAARNISEDPVDEQAEQVRAMNSAISELSGVDKALVMLYLDNHSYLQIGEILGITVNNVAVKMNRIKIVLKEKTKKYL